MNDSTESLKSEPNQFKVRSTRLPPEVTRVLFVKNLPYKLTNDELYALFGKYGAIRQIRKGISNETKGTAYVVYDDIYEAKAALESLSGFMVSGRYLVVLYYRKEKAAKRKQEAIEASKVAKLREQVLQRAKLQAKQQRMQESFKHL